MKKRDLIPSFVPGDLDLLILLKNRHEADALYEQLNVGEEECVPDYPRTMKNMMCVKKCRLAHGVVIDFIVVSGCDSCLDYIDQHFDFEFCECWFDGKTLCGPCEAVKTRKCSLLFNPLFPKNKLTPEELLEYCERVRKFVPVSNADQLIFIDDHFGYLKRLDKYTKRGFTIDVSQFVLPPDYIKRMIYQDSIQVAEEFRKKYRDLKIPLTAIMLFHVSDESKGIESERKMVMGHAKYFIEECVH